MTAGRNRARLQACLVATVLLAAGCGGSAAPVSDEASRALSADVANLRTAATLPTTARALRAAEALRLEVAQQTAAGHLQPDRANAILAQLDRVLADLTVSKPAPAATSGSARPTDSTGGAGRSDGDGGGDGGSEGGGDGGGEGD